MRSVFGALALVIMVGSWSAPAWGWHQRTHQKMTADALRPVAWLDQYRDIRVTPFEKMLEDVCGEARPAGSRDFRFLGHKNRQRKHHKYMEQTGSMADPAMRRFARHLLLSEKLSLEYRLGEGGGRPVTARKVLATYAAEPDQGMDIGLDASRDQRIMGGTAPDSRSSKRFRHMSFLPGVAGEGPRRAQLFFDLGARALQKGHPYWGFRFAAWGLHYLEDMGAPLHTNQAPSLGFVRLKHMVRPGGKLNTRVLADVARGFSAARDNYHALYEGYVERVYTRKRGGRTAGRLSAAVEGAGRESGPRGLLGRLLAPRTVQGIAKQRSLSGLGARSICRSALCFFTGEYRQPAKNGPSSTGHRLSKEDASRVVRQAGRRLRGESQGTYRHRLEARRAMLDATAREFSRNGTALRRAINILGRQVREPGPTRRARSRAVHHSR